MNLALVGFSTFVGSIMMPILWKTELISSFPNNLYNLATANPGYGPSTSCQNNT
jgi:hypothetical protein